MKLNQEEGVRAEVGPRLGIDDEPVDEGRLFRRKAWLRFQRDPETGDLPFGVW